MLMGRFSDNSPFSRKYMPRDVFKLIWKYVYYYKLDKINDKLDNEINKIKNNKNKSIFNKIIQFLHKKLNHIFFIIKDVETDEGV